MPDKPKATITVVARLPRSADETPTEIDGIPVVDYEMPPRVIRRFYRSQLERMTLEEAQAQADAIAEARNHNLIVDDVTPRELLESMDAAEHRTAMTWQAAIRLRDSKAAADKAFKEYRDSKSYYERFFEGRVSSPEALGAEHAMHEHQQRWEKANQEHKDAIAAQEELN